MPFRSDDHEIRKPGALRRGLSNLGDYYGQIVISCVVLLLALGTVMVFSASF